MSEPAAIMLRRRAVKASAASVVRQIPREWSLLLIDPLVALINWQLPRGHREGEDHHRAAIDFVEAIVLP